MSVDERCIWVVMTSVKSSGAVVPVCWRASEQEATDVIRKLRDQRSQIYWSMPVSDGILDEEFGTDKHEQTAVSRQIVASQYEEKAQRYYANTRERVWSVVAGLTWTRPSGARMTSSERIIAFLSLGDPTTQWKESEIVEATRLTQSVIRRQLASLVAASQISRSPRGLYQRSL